MRSWSLKPQFPAPCRRYWKYYARKNSQKTSIAVRYNLRVPHNFDFRKTLKKHYSLDFQSKRSVEKKSLARRLPPISPTQISNRTRKYLFAIKGRGRKFTRNRFYLTSPDVWRKIPSTENLRNTTRHSLKHRPLFHWKTSFHTNAKYIHQRIQTFSTGPLPYRHQLRRLLSINADKHKKPFSQ